MKKIFFFFTFITLLFVACEQPSEDLISASEVKIFMSGADENAQLRSTDERQAIQQGDTVDVYDVQNINLILTAEEENETPIDGHWELYNVDSDLNYDVNTVFVRNLPSGSFKGSNTSIKLSTLGLYAVYFYPKNGASSIMFYIRHSGIPGSLGDDWQNDQIFRLDKVSYQIANLSFSGYTLYLRYRDLRFNYQPFPYDESGEMNPALEKNWKAFVACDNNKFITKTGIEISGKEFQLRKCRYSKDYVCFSFLKEECPVIKGEYNIFFYSGDFWWNWWTFPAVQKSDWERNGQIVFKII